MNIQFKNKDEYEWKGRMNECIIESGWIYKLRIRMNMNEREEWMNVLLNGIIINRSGIVYFNCPVVSADYTVHSLHHSIGARIRDGGGVKKIPSFWDTTFYIKMVSIIM